jgi:hypothetical protein
LGSGGGEGEGHVARTSFPQPTQSSNTVPSLFIPPFGAPTTDGVPASLGGVPGLEPESVLCDAVAVTVGRVGVYTRCRHWRTSEKEGKHRVPVRHSVSSESTTSKMKPPAIPCVQLRTLHQYDPQLGVALWRETYCVWQMSHFLLFRATSWCDCSATSTTMSPSSASNNLDAWSH